MITPNAKAQTVLKQISYATLATVDPNGKPWNTPVYFAFDDGWNLYWGSHVESQHSQNIRANGEAFIVVYDSTAEAGTGLGVYIQAHVVELLDATEIATAHKLIQGRRPNPYWKLEEVQPDRPVHLFKAVPERIWTNTGGNKDGQYIDVRVDAES